MIFVLRTHTLKSFSDTHMNMRSKVGTRYTRCDRRTLSPWDVQLCTYSWGMPLDWHGIAGVTSDDIASLSWLSQLFHAPKHFSLKPSLPLPSSKPELPIKRRNTSPSPHRWVLVYTFPTYRRILADINKCLKTKKYLKRDLILYYNHYGHVLY